MRDRLADIGDFLAALRTGGVPVGPGELARLQYLFERTPRLDRDGLKALLAALLVKTPEQRETFERLFVDWCPDRDADWPQEAETTPPEPDRWRPSPPLVQPDREGGDEAPPLRRRWWLWFGLIALALLVIGLLVWLGWPTEDPVRPVVKEELPTVPAPPLPETKPPPGPPADPVKRVWFWRAEINTEEITVPPRLEWPWLVLLGLAALALALAAWWHYQRQFPRIKPRPPPRHLFGWKPLPPPDRDEGALVGGRERRQMIWNVERFVADDPTRRLDLDQTVDATAHAGGFTRLCFEPAVYDREIWFWVDRELVRPTPRTAVEQLLVALSNAGLRARRGDFIELPLRVDWPGQPGYRPETQENQGRQALVAILTNGEGLARRLDNLRDRGPAQRLLRSLRRWPRLCFVDCSTRGNQLAQRLAPYGIEVIALEQLPYWLGGLAAPARLASPLGAEPFGPERKWAAVVALGGVQADSASAQSLRAELGLAASPWDVDRRLAEARRDRSALINWLLRGEPLGEDDLPRQGSLTRRALAWWRRRYRDADRRMERRENPLLPWRDSLASRRWQLEQALLQLYVEPEAAAENLTQLADNELRAEIRERLAEFAAAEHRPAGSEDDVYIYLTWSLEKLPVLTRHRLRQLGFADELYRREPPAFLELAPRLVLAVSALGALAMAAFGVALHRGLAENPPRLVVDKDKLDIKRAVEVAPTIEEIEFLGGDDGYQVTVGSARHTVSVKKVPAGARVKVNWYWGNEGKRVEEERDDEAGEDNVLQFEDSDSVVLRAGTLAQPIRACSESWPERSLVVIASSYKTDRKARQLAIRLLDRGGADQVLIGTDWEKRLDGWLGRSQKLNKKTQLLVVLPSSADADAAASYVFGKHLESWAVVSAKDFTRLTEKIQFWKEGAKTVQALEELLTVHHRRGQVLIGGGPGWEHDERTQIDWVNICPGTFTMGSGKGDKMADEDELVDPPRIVTLAPFQIARTEITNAKYKRLRSEHDKSDEFPVVRVFWKQAQDFCEDAGGDLPTEAQWEYAARGGSRFRWSFGDDEEQLGNYAWFRENSSDQAHEVAKKWRNPLGLYDMHGNVWEWVGDWYGRYTGGMLVNPMGPDSGECPSWFPADQCRVVRGGSFADPPALLRSALRVGVRPGVRGRLDGFRCVRVPPQP